MDLPEKDRRKLTDGGEKKKSRNLVRVRVLVWPQQAPVPYSFEGFGLWPTFVGPL